LLDSAFEAGSSSVGWNALLLLNDGHGAAPLATTAAVITNNASTARTIHDLINLPGYTISGGNILNVANVTWTAANVITANTALTIANQLCIGQAGGCMFAVDAQFPTANFRLSSITAAQPAYQEYSTSVSALIIGAEGTAGGTLCPGSAASAFIICATNAVPLQFFTSNVLRGQFTTAGFLSQNFGIVSAGTAPTTTGSTCTIGAQLGGASFGSVVLTCTAQSLVLNFANTAPNFWQCDAEDITTPADLIRQTARGTTSATFASLTTAATDVIQFKCFAY
jgi:hypothetical protein